MKAETYQLTTTVQAIQLSKDNMDEVEIWVEPYGEVNKERTGIRMTTPDGLVIAVFGDWIVWDITNRWFMVYTDEEFKKNGIRPLSATKEIILDFLLENTDTDSKYTGGGWEMPVIAFTGSGDEDKEKFLSTIADDLVKKLNG